MFTRIVHNVFVMLAFCIDKESYTLYLFKAFIAGSSNLPRQSLGMIIYVYILKNRENRYYIGITKLDPILRRERHNRGHVFSTRYRGPWHLIYSERYDSYEKARGREKQIKNWKGGNAFKHFLSMIRGSSKGRTPGSGPGNWGSNPCPRAIERK